MKRRTANTSFCLMTGRALCLLAAIFLSLAPPDCGAQDTSPSWTENPPASAQPPGSKEQLPVNWLYGAFVPKEAPLHALSDADRWRLFVRMSFTTPGIYIKPGFFTVSDQARDAPPGWPQDPDGFAKRLGTRYAQFLMQNSFTAIGDAMPGWEVRYDRCRNCSGIWQRVKHATVRNFVTYGSDEKSLRPQVFLYAASFAGASLSALWQPYRPSPLVKGYQGVATQAWVGVSINLLSEFAPDLKRAIGRDKRKAAIAIDSRPCLQQVPQRVP